MGRAITRPVAAELDLRKMFDDAASAVGSVLNLIGVGEREIEAAMRRHPKHADALWHCFSLIQPTGGGDGVGVHEQLYRSHARELLDRVAAGQDLRHATSAEVLLAMKEVSLETPMNNAGIGLYWRMWQACGMPEITEAGGDHYEALSASSIDEAEAQTRRKLSKPGRVWDPAAVECMGLHHGEPVACRFALSPSSSSEVMR